MAIYLIDPGVRTGRPTGLFAANRHSPQVRGLTAWWASVSGGLIPAWPGTPPAFPESSAPTVAGVSEGLAIFSGTSNASWKTAALTSRFLPGTNCTWTAAFYYGGSADTSAIVFGTAYSIPWGSPYATGFVAVGGSGKSVGFFNNDTNVESLSALSIGFHTMAMGVDSTNTRYLWIDGVLQATGLGGGPIGSSATSCFVFGDPAENGRKTDCKLLDARFYEQCLTDAEVLALHDPDTRLDLYWQPSRRVFFDVSAAGGSVITPGVGSLVITGKAPSLSTAVNIATGKGSEVFTGKAPTLSTGVNLSVDKGSIVLTGKAPSLSTGVNIATGQGSLVFTGQAPNLQRTFQVSPSAGSVVFGGQQPTVSATTGTTISPSVGSVVFTGKAPTLFVAVNVATGKGQLTYTGKAPTVQSGQLVSTSAGSLVYSGKAPTVQVSYTIVVGSGSVILTGKAPSITGAETVSVGKGSVVFSGQVPSLSTGLVTQPSTGQVTYTGKAPSLQTSYAIGVGCGSLVFAGKAPTSVNSGVLISTIYVTGNYAPTVHLTGNYSPTIHVTGEYQ